MAQLAEVMPVEGMLICMDAVSHSATVGGHRAHVPAPRPLKAGCVLIQERLCSLLAAMSDMHFTHFSTPS